MMMRLMCMMVLGLAGMIHNGFAVDPELAGRVTDAITRGSRFLQSKQLDDGSWISHPAVTGLCVIAIHDTDSQNAARVKQAVNNGLDYILQSVQPDGSIWTENAHAYPNYTTAISLVALSTVNRPGDLDAIRSARRYLMDSQFQDRNSIDYGGIGYSKTGRADLTNLTWTAEALYHTDYLDQETQGDSAVAAQQVRDLWEKVQVFITNCQNLPEMNKQDWVSKRDDDYGGFVYRPTESKSGSLTDASGKVSLLSSGSVTYAGLMSMIYAKMDKDDYRVKGAMSYIRNHYTLEENPGMGVQGLYYYLNIMTKAFNAYSEDVIVDAGGTPHKWRSEVTEKFLSMQQPDGHWINENGRYMESVPELVTAHSVTAMKIALGSD